MFDPADSSPDESREPGERPAAEPAPDTPRLGGLFSVPSHADRARADADSGSGRSPQPAVGEGSPGPRLFVEEPLGFWVRRGLLAAPLILWAASSFVGGGIALVVLLTAVVRGRTAEGLPGSPHLPVAGLAIIAALAIVPAVPLTWEATLVLSRTQRRRPWQLLLAFAAVAAALWLVLLMVSWPGLGIALTGLVYVYSGALAALALVRGQPDGLPLPRSMRGRS